MTLPDSPFLSNGWTEVRSSQRTLQTLQTPLWVGWLCFINFGWFVVKMTIWNIVLIESFLRSERHTFTKWCHFQWYKTIKKRYGMVCSTVVFRFCLTLGKATEVIRSNINVMNRTGLLNRFYSLFSDHFNRNALWKIVKRNSGNNSICANGVDISVSICLDGY